MPDSPEPPPPPPMKQPPPGSSSSHQDTTHEPHVRLQNVCGIPSSRHHHASSPFAAAATTVASLPEVIMDDATRQAQLEQAWNALIPALARMPAAERAALETARQRHGDLVNVETSPITVTLACPDLNVAARKLTRYWHHRRIVFGGDHADRDQEATPVHQDYSPWLRPLTQSSDTGSALGPVELEVLRSGHLCILPGQIDDNNNGSMTRRPVLCYDRSRLDKDFETDQKGANSAQTESALLQARLRVLFYLCHVLAQNDGAEHNDGFVFLLLVNPSFDAAHYDRVFFQRYVEMLQDDALPLAQHSMHLAVRPPRIGRRTFMEESVPRLQAVLDLLRITYVLHAGKSEKQVTESLLEHGFTMEGLPRSVGGTWHYHLQLTSWRQQRVPLEKAWYTALGISTGVVTASDSNDVGKATSAADRMAAAAAILSNAQHQQRKREMDVVYARRKRARRRVNLSQLRSQIQQLEENNARVRAENDVLSTLVQQVLVQVGQYHHHHHQHQKQQASGPSPSVPSVDATTWAMNGTVYTNQPGTIPSTGFVPRPAGSATACPEDLNASVLQQLNQYPNLSFAQRQHPSPLEQILALHGNNAMAPNAAAAPLLPWMMALQQTSALSVPLVDPAPPAWLGAMWPPPHRDTSSVSRASDQAAAANAEGAVKQPPTAPEAAAAGRHGITDAAAATADGQPEQDMAATILAMLRKQQQDAVHFSSAESDSDESGEDSGKKPATK